MRRWIPASCPLLSAGFFSTGFFSTGFLSTGFLSLAVLTAGLLADLPGQGRRRAHFPDTIPLRPPSALERFWSWRRPRFAPPAVKLPAAEQALVLDRLLRSLARLPARGRPLPEMLLAVATLGEARPVAAAEALRRWIPAADPTVREAAMLGLAMLGEPSWGAWGDGRWGQGVEASSRAPARRFSTQLVLGSLLWPDRARGKRFLGRRLAPKVRAEVARHAARSLGVLAAHRHATPRDRQEILSALEARWHHLGTDRHAAIDHLAVLDGLSMIPAADGSLLQRGLMRIFTRAWDDAMRPIHLRSAAVRALGMVLGRGLGEARQHYKFRCAGLLTHRDPQLRGAAMQALESMCTGAAEDGPFRAALQRGAEGGDHELSLRALAALAAAAGPETPGFLLALGAGAKDSERRGAAGLALGMCWWRTMPVVSAAERTRRCRVFRERVAKARGDAARFGWVMGWSLVDPGAARSALCPPVRLAGPGRPPPPDPLFGWIAPDKPVDALRWLRVVGESRQPRSQYALRHLARIGGARLPGSIGASWPRHLQAFGATFEHETFESMRVPFWIVRPPGPGPWPPGPPGLRPPGSRPAPPGPPGTPGPGRPRVWSRPRGS